MLTSLQAFILGVVEGITEYLPVSSTGHLIIASSLLGLDKPEAVKAAVDDFNIIIQGGAILAVVGLYWPRFVQMVRGLMGKDRVGLSLFINIVIAFLPAAGLGFLLHKKIKTLLFHPWPVIGAFIVGGIFMIAIDRIFLARWRKGGHSASAERDLNQMSPLQALIVGIMQVFAMWPGTSRSMMTISGGVVAGLGPRAAAEFSFLLGVPTLLAATGWDLYKNLKEAKATGQPDVFHLLGVTPTIIGLVTAAVFAAIAIKWLVAFLNKHGLTPFGIYRILLALALIGMVTRGMVNIEPDAPAAPSGTPGAVPGSMTTPTAP